MIFQIQNMMVSLLAGTEDHKIGAKELFEDVSAQLNKSKANRDLDEIDEKFAVIIEDQLKNCKKKRPSYSTESFELSYLLYAKSPACYKTLREKKYLKLPHHDHLRKLARRFNIRPHKHQENIEYFKNMISKLSDVEKVVNISGDEVYMKSGLSLKNGKLRGFAANHPKLLATTSLVLYVNSIFGNFGEVFSINPVSNLTANDLESFFDYAIETLQAIGFTVVSLSVDGNRVNQKFYSEKSKNSEATLFFDNPTKPGEKIFLFFDSLHLFKNLRNNWLAGEYAKENPLPAKLQFPRFPDDELNGECVGEIIEADFNDLRQIYRESRDRFENEGQVIHNVYGLTARALWINNYDRQREGLVRQIFNERTSAELKRRGKHGTAAYIDIVNRWEHLMNTKSPGAGSHARIREMEPYRSIDDAKLDQLQQYAEWIHQWKAKDFPGVKTLSADTFEAFYQTTGAMQVFVAYIFARFKPK